jgi:hypothetical protein
MKRVISGVLAMLVVLPALEISSGINGRDTPLALGGLHMLHSTALTGGSASQAFNSSLQVGGRAGATTLHVYNWMLACTACSSVHASAVQLMEQPACCSQPASIPCWCCLHDV